jgi:hypothetical protein
MYSLETIKDMNEQRCDEAKKKKLQPFVISLKSQLAKMPPFPFPNFGDYRPKGWMMTRKFFVDSSGMGQEGEMALTVEQFIKQIKQFRGYAIIEEGQFQVYVGEFIRYAETSKELLEAVQKSQNGESVYFDEVKNGN